MPLIMIVREVLGIAKNSREAETIIKSGEIAVDGRVRLDSRLPVGLMDVVDIPRIGKSYRMVPSKTSPLTLVEIPNNEKAMKLCELRSKKSEKGGGFQCGFHDGRSILVKGEVSLKVGDSSLIDIPSQKIVKNLSLKNDSMVIITGGQSRGLIGKISQIHPGSISRPAMATISIAGSKVEAPLKMMMVVGDEKPAITISGAI
jgi:small subunit ribosomal protein S4e